MLKHDILIIGAGLSGAVFAHEAASNGYKCLVIDKRDHIGGNCYDYLDQYGNMIHTYGPHYFRTNSKYIFDYLSQFTDWTHVQYQILSWTNGQYWNFPINLFTIEQLLHKKLNSELAQSILNSWKVPIDNPKNSEEIIISQVGWKLYEMFFKGYTIKQWKKDPKELDPSVCGRIPIRTNRNNAYFNDKIQALPTAGYSHMIKNMLDHKNIKVELGVDNFRRITGHKIAVYTGPVDNYFNYEYGVLPYRSLRFKLKHYEKEFYQPAVQINYPNDYNYTRTIETKHITGLKSKVTAVVEEYPESYDNTNEPFYPIPNEESKCQYQLYHNLIKNETNVIFLGRLGTYQYLNMDQVVGMALKKIKTSGVLND